MNNRGISLVSTLVGAAIASIVTLGVGTLLVDVLRATRIAEQHAEAMSLRTVLMKVISDPGNCTNQILNPASTAAVTLDPNSPDAVLKGTTIVPQSEAIFSSVDENRDGVLGDNGPELVRAGSVVPGTSTGLRVQSVRFTEFEKTGNDNRVIGQLVIAFDPNSTAAAMPPIKIAAAIEVENATKQPRKCSAAKADASAEAICSLTGKTLDPVTGTCASVAGGPVSYLFTSAGIGGCLAAPPGYSLAHSDCLQSSVYQCEDYACLWVK